MARIENWVMIMGYRDFPGGSAGKESACNGGDLGLIPELGRSSGGWKGYPLKYSGLKNSMDYTVCNFHFSSVQFSSVVQSCPTLCQPMDCSTPGLPVYHQFPKLTQTHVHWVSDALQPSHPLLSPSPPAFNLSQYQGLFKWVSSSHQVAKVLEFQPQQQSFQWIFRTDFHWDGLVGFPFHLGATNKFGWIDEFANTESVNSDK